MEELKKEKDKYITKIFWLGLQISFIFAIPAMIGLVVGKKLDVMYKTNNTITIFILFFTFIFSWFLVFIKYNKLNKKLKEINKTIKEEQQN